jgi:hypothetical protein
MALHEMRLPDFGRYHHGAAADTAASCRFCCKVGMWEAREGRADSARRPDRRSHAARANLGRTTPPIFSSVSFRQGQDDVTAVL